jgi:hypothetical protein
MRKALGALCAAAYIATIWLANYLVSHYGIVDVGFGLMAPAAVYAVGVAFTMRDFTQDLLATERRDLLGPDCHWEVPEAEPLPDRISSWPYQYARQEFLRTHVQLTNRLRIERTRVDL